ncbi:MAG: hypothetical protein U0354_18965 [Candidatus Sericytochromatia bacterium]
MKKILLISLLSSLVMSSSVVYSQDINNTKTINSQNMNNFEDILKKIESMDFDSTKIIENDLFRILDTKSDNEKSQIIQKILDSPNIKVSKYSDINIKVYIALRYYKSLAQSQKEIIKSFSKTNNLGEPNITNYSLRRMFDYIPEIDRNEIITNIIKYKPTYIDYDIIEKTNNPDIFKIYIEKILNANWNNEIITFINLYDKLPEELRYKLFEKIITNIYTYESSGNAELFFRFLFQNYNKLTDKYKEKILFISEKSVNYDILNISNTYESNSFENFPLNDRNKILDINLNKIKHKLPEIINSSSKVKDYERTNSIKVITSILLNYQYFSEKNKSFIIKNIDVDKLYTFLFTLLIDNYDKFDKDLTSLIPKIIKSGIKSSEFIYPIVHKYNSLPQEITSLLEIYASDSKISENLSNSISNYSQLFPKEKLIKLVTELSKNPINDKGVIRTIISRYDIMPDNLRDLLEKHIKAKTNLRELLISTLKNYNKMPKHIIDMILPFSDEVDSSTLCDAISDSFSYIPKNIQLDLLNKLSKRNNIDGLCDYEIFSEYKEQIPNEIWVKLFSKEPDYNDYNYSESKNENKSNNSFSELTKEQKLEQINNLLNSKESSEQALLLFIEYIDDFDNEQITSFVSKVLLLKNINESYLGYLLADKFDKLPINISEKISLKLYKKDKISTFVNFTLSQHFDKFSVNTKNTIIKELFNTINKKYLQKKYNEEQSPIIFGSINIRVASIDPQKRPLKEKIDKITQCIDRFSDYYLFNALFQGYEQLSLEDKKDIKRILDNKNLNSEKSVMLSLIINFLPQELFLETFKGFIKSKEGRDILFFSLFYSLKQDFLNPQDDFYSNPTLTFSTRQEYIFTNLKDYLLKNNKKDELLLFLICYITTLPESNKKLTLDLIKSTDNINEVLKRKNLHYFLGNFPQDIKQAILNKLEENFLPNEETIWQYANNYSKFSKKVKLDINKLDNKNLKNFASAFIFTYRNFPENERVKIIKKLSLNKVTSVYASFTLKNNFNLFSSELRDELINNLLKTDKLNQIPITYLLLENYILLPEKLKKKLIEFSKDKELSKYVAKGLIYNYTKILPKELTIIVNNLKSNKEALPYLIIAVGRNMTFLPDSISKSIFKYYKDPELRKNILNSLFSGYYPYKERMTVINQYLNNKSDFWDTIGIIVPNIEYIHDKSTEYIKALKDLENEIVKINKYKDKNSKYTFNMDDVLNRQYLAINLTFYKNWDNMPEKIRKELGDVLYNLITDPKLEKQNEEMMQRVTRYLNKIISILINNINNMDDKFRTKLFTDIALNQHTNFILLDLMNKNKFKLLPDKLGAKMLKIYHENYEFSSSLTFHNANNAILSMSIEERFALLASLFLKDEKKDYYSDTSIYFSFYKNIVEFPVY